MQVQCFSDGPGGHGVKVFSLHHDINTVTGEEVVLFASLSRPMSATQEEIGPAIVLIPKTGCAQNQSNRS
jgi:hypothetical protein